MADNKAQLVVDGDVSPLRQKLRDAGRDLNRFGDEGKRAVERVASPIDMLTSKFLGLGAVLSIGGFATLAKSAIDAADGLNDLSQQLGIGVPQLAGYKLAAESSGLTLETFGNSVKRLSMYMAQYPDRLRAAGITARDAEGALMQLADQFARVPDGAQKTAFAMTLMGRSGAEMIPLLNGGGSALQEMIKRGRELYPVTQEMAAQADAFNDSLQEMQVGAQGITIQLGNWLLPILNRAISLWRDNAKEIGNMNAALVGLGSLGIVGQTIGVLWANVSYVFKQVGNELGGIAAQLAAILRGDFKGASIISDMMKRDAEVARQEIDALEKRIMGMGNKIAAPKVEVAASGDSTETPPNWSAVTNLGGSGKGKTGKQVSDAEWAMEEAAQLQRTLYEIDQERNEYHEAANKAVLEADKKLVKEMDQIQLLRIEGARNAELARIDEMQAQAQYELDMGSLTQAEYLSRLAAFNQQRLAAEQLFIEQKREVVAQDPEQNPVELERLEQEKAEIRRRYRQQDLEIQRQQAVESQSIWRSLGDSISGLWDKGVQALMNSTLTWKNAMQAIGAEIVRWFAVQVVGEMVKRWIAGEAAKFAASMGWKGMQEALEKVAAVKSVGIKATETEAVVGMDAIQAGTGAAKSQAGIPIVGPILALAAMAAIFAAVSAMGKKKSAAGGYDIPKGVNPMTQLHEEEMVLPKHLANAVRGMAAGGAGEGAASAVQPVNVNITSHNARGVRELFMDNPDILAEAIRKAVRNGFK